MNYEPLKLGRRTLLKVIGLGLVAPSAIILGQRPSRVVSKPLSRVVELVGISYTDIRLMEVTQEYQLREDKLFARGMLYSCRSRGLTPVKFEFEDLGKQKVDGDHYNRPYEASCTFVTLFCIRGQWNGKGFVPIYEKGKGSTTVDISL